MKIIRKLFVCFLVLISIISIFPTIPVKAANLVVTLDPGHGGSDPGATGASAFGGMTEAEYNWIFCQYTKERLEQYGITVYLTRTQNQTLESLSARAHTAASYGSDAFVSIHCNSASASAEGSEVLVPNNNYRPAIGASSQSAATQVLNSLVAATGNKNRGLLLKNSQSGSTYPDGSIRDYYGIIANGKLQNIPVVMLVETGFVSNQGDYNRTFATDAVRKKVAYSIADGLAAYYGLSLAPQGPKVLRTVIDGLNYIDADGNTVGQAFTPGAYDSWTDKRITIDTGKITTLFDWGWIAFNADTYQFGYIINGKQRYRNAFTVEPEAAVTQQAASLGASKASRFECRLDTSWLSEGTNTVQVVVRLNGEENIFVLSEYTVYTTGVVDLNIDELKYLDESGNQIGQAFSPGAYGSWSDKTISINTDNVKTLVDRGWVVFHANTYQFGYIINGKKRYRNAFVVEPEDAVILHALARGATKASRFECKLDTSWLREGTNTVQVVVRLDGEPNFAVLSEYTVNAYKTHVCSWDSGSVTTPSTHTSEGVKTYTCTGCSKTKTEAIPKLTEHTYGAWQRHDTTQHKKICECTDVVYAPHSWDSGAVKKYPSHLAKGSMLFTCTDCGQTKTEEIPTIASHTHTSWQKHDDAQHKKVCACGDTVYAEHLWNDGEITQPPTAELEGVRTYTCNDCGQTRTEAVERLSAESSSKDTAVTEQGESDETNNTEAKATDTSAESLDGCSSAIGRLTPAILIVAVFMATLLRKKKKTDS